jgi:SAM-dependent methyltransferase
MPAMDRLLREQRFHDRQARSRAVTYAAEPERLRFRDADYLDHETWVRPAMTGLGAVEGQPVLDLGCGHGMAAVVLARRGAVVTACDLSAGYVLEARKRARANEVDVHFLQADGHRLPFAAESFAAVWGHAILHHLDVPVAARELWRVIRPGGVAVFCEPWSGNPLARLARRWLPYSGKGHTADEEPLCPRHVRQVGEVFADMAVEGFQVFGGLRRACPLLGSILNRADQWLLPGIPSLRRFGRYVVVTLRRGCREPAASLI